MPVKGPFISMHACLLYLSRFLCPNKTNCLTVTLPLNEYPNVISDSLARLSSMLYIVTPWHLWWAAQLIWSYWRYWCSRKPALVQYLGLFNVSFKVINGFCTYCVSLIKLANEAPFPWGHYCLSMIRWFGCVLCQHPIKITWPVIVVSASAISN